jgi:hypothetical protein
VAGILAPVRPSSTPSACSSRSSAGPPPRSATHTPRTGGPGSSSRSTPSSASPGHSPATCACPGNAPPHQGGSPRPASAAGLETSARPSPAQPVRRNPANPAPDGRQDQRTTAPHPATTSGRPPEGNAPSKHSANAQVKRQAKKQFQKLAACVPVSSGSSHVRPSGLAPVPREAWICRRPRVWLPQRWRGGGSIPVSWLTWAPSIWRRSPARWQTRPTRTPVAGQPTDRGDRVLDAQHRHRQADAGRPPRAGLGLHRSTAVLRCSPLVCRDVHYDRLLCDSGDHQSPPLRRRNNDLREVGGLITTQTVTLEFSGGLSSRGRPRREEQP